MAGTPTGTGGGNVFSNLSNALLGPQMAPWWALALGGTRQQQASGFQSGIENLSAHQRDQQKMAYQKEQDAIANSMAQQKFQAQMAELEYGRTEREQKKQIEDMAVKAIAQQQDMSEEQARLLYHLDEKSRSKAAGFTQFADPKGFSSAAGKEYEDYRLAGGPEMPFNEFLEQRRSAGKPPPNVGGLEKGEILLGDAETGWRIEDIPSPGKEAGARQKATAASTVVQDANRALGVLDKYGMAAGGVGALTAGIPMTPAKELAGHIDSIKGNIGIDSLLKIKEAGSGLGHVPQAQLNMLASLLGNLDVQQHPRVIKENLERIIWIYEDIIAKEGGDPLEMYQARMKQGVGGGGSTSGGAIPLDDYLSRF